MRRQRGRVTLTRMHARSCVKIEKELTLKIPPEDGYVVPYMQASRTEAVDRCLADGAEGTYLVRIIVCTRGTILHYVREREKNAEA